jgi:hypothetical protein
MYTILSGNNGLQQIDLKQCPCISNKSLCTLFPHKPLDIDKSHSYQTITRTYYVSLTSEQRWPLTCRENFQISTYNLIAVPMDKPLHKTICRLDSRIIRSQLFPASSYIEKDPDKCADDLTCTAHCWNKHPDLPSKGLRYHKSGSRPLAG